jgi:DNA-binding response OmpR family regulator
VKLLFVENHEVFRQVVTAQFLSDLEVLPVARIVDARGALARERFDCVLVDYNLDDGKGTELVRWCRALGMGVPIIGVSSDEEGNALLLSAGANDLCPKASFRQLRAVIARHVG